VERVGRSGRDEAIRPPFFMPSVKRQTRGKADFECGESSGRLAERGNSAVRSTLERYAYAGRPY
jgi:hypothetical protein